MKNKLLCGVVAGTLAAISAGFSTQAIADGTASLDLKVDANITAGTCSASILDGATETSVINFGNVYVSEVWAKTKVKPFKLRFSDCAGLKDKKASLVIAPRNAGCAGGHSNNAEFSNASPETSKAQRTAVELWTTDTPEGSNSVQFHCYNKNAQEIDLSSVSSTTSVDYPLSARMVPVTGFAITELTAGDFYSPTTFTITYQ
ncbi:fimbrial protein [Salmonella enterica subsp. salamae]|nr:fimbrial protein [Salmonella enterica subsp. salamae]ECI4075062.1 fimbrial protein [Salmonella enterica subsp. salamae]EEO2379735.1 fimbrial protein [Salmonella enterica]